MSKRDEARFRMAQEHRQELMRTLEKIKRLKDADEMHRTAHEVLEKVWADLRAFAERGPLN